MGYLSFDASVKIHQSGRYSNTKSAKSGTGGYVGYLRHLDRADDKRDGIELQHSNENIDPDYTLNNESCYKDENGNWVTTSHASDMVHSVERRLDFARTHGAVIYSSGKKDSVIVRPLIFQLDEDVIEDHKDTWISDLVHLAEDRFGADNIVGFSVHRDEDSTHLHVVFVPVSETKDENGDIKCTLSQKKFFSSPRALAEMHRSLRQELRDKGYDISLENKPVEENQPNVFLGSDNLLHKGKGLTPDQLKALSDRKIQLRLEETDLKVRRNELEGREKSVDAATEELEDREKDVAEQVREIQVRENAIQKQQKQLNTLEEDLDGEREELEKSLELLNVARKEYEAATPEISAEYEKFLKTIKNKKTGQTAYDLVRECNRRFKESQADKKVRLQKMFDIAAEYAADQKQPTGKRSAEDDIEREAVGGARYG